MSCGKSFVKWYWTGPWLMACKLEVDHVGDCGVVAPVSIKDVPCFACQRGYDGEHRCDDPDRCACDRVAAHSG